MTPTEARRPHSGMTLLALALGALALLAMPGLAAAKDRNHDRIPDRWEKRHKLSLTVNQARHDQDGDHLRNRGEFLAGDNPRDRDSDDDGTMDGEEQAGHGEEPGDDNGGDREDGDDNSGPSDNPGPGSDNSGPGHEGDDDGDRICTTAELVPGAAVEEAELRVENGRATFEEVELSGRAVGNG